MCFFLNCGYPFSSGSLLQLQIEGRNGFNLGSPSCWTGGHCKHLHWLLHDWQLHRISDRLICVHQGCYFLYYLCNHRQYYLCIHYEDYYYFTGNYYLRLYFSNLNEIAARRYQYLDLHTICNNGEGYHIHLSFHQQRFNYIRSEGS